ncbi:MAG: hypothetical protein JHD16_06540, partial [Solirubrobacteraceae bacterium]|nr:hypothetical protein [Solirubrobacteraceae bacterium]
MGARVRLTAIAFGMAFLMALTGWLLLGAPGAARSSASIDSSGWAGAIRP